MSVQMSVLESEGKDFTFVLNNSEEEKVIFLLVHAPFSLPRPDQTSALGSNKEF